MRVYNPMTVIRQTSRKLLQAFFAEQGCLDFIDFEKDKLYEIQDAFRTLPEKAMTRAEGVMRNVFTLAGDESVLLRILDEALRHGIHSRAIPNSPSQLEWKTGLPWANRRGSLNFPL